MEINERELRSLVERIMELTLSAVEASKRRTLVVFSGKSDKRFLNVLSSLRAEGEEDISVVALPEHMESESFAKDVCSLCRHIISPQKLIEEPFSYDRIVFPVMPRNVLIKTALCIEDIYEVQILRKAFEEGIKTEIAAGGLDRFTGREPDKYKEKILGYIRTVLEYGIEIRLDTEKR